MLENIVAWVLNNYIGEYLEDLNTDQLSIALLSGQLELENVPFKKTALRKLDLPLQIRSGLLGKLTLSIPITRMRSEPWVLRLSDVLIVLGPPSANTKYDVEAIEQVEQQRKETLLDELEKKHKTELLSLMGIPDPNRQDNWWGASLISAVINNIQLILTNVHVRYEDDTSLPNGYAFQCGFRIQNMTMQTTNSDWKSGFVEPKEGVNVFKILDLKGFSFYWNPDVKPTENWEDKKSTKRIRELLAPEDPLCSFVIQPCSVELRMEKNASKFPLKGSEPRFKFFLQPKQITVELSRRQMTELRALSREWARFDRARQHRKWRPLTAIKDGASREWWKFAFERVLDETKHRSQTTWANALQRARHLNAYCRAYRRRLLGLLSNPTASNKVADPGPSTTTPSTSNSLGTLSQEDRTVMKQIERDSQFSYFELQTYREAVFRIIVREKEKELGISADSEATFEEGFESIEPPTAEASIAAANAQKAEGKGLYNWISGFFVASTAEVQQQENPFDVSKFDFSDLNNVPKSFKEVEEEILDVLHETWDDSTLLRRDMLLAEMVMKLEHLTLRFVDTTNEKGVEQKRVLSMDLLGIMSRIELSPKQHSLSVSLAVNDMSIQRLHSGHPTHSPSTASLQSRKDDSLMYSNVASAKVLFALGKDSKVSADKPVFRLQYRRRAPKIVVHHTVDGSFEPLTLLYEEHALVGMSQLFDDDPTLAIAKVSEATSESRQVARAASMESRIIVNLHLPSISMELRHQGFGAVSTSEWQIGEPFATVMLENLAIGISSCEAYLTEVKCSLGHLELRDKMESEKDSLLATGRSVITSNLSRSCPDLASSVEPKTPISSVACDDGLDDVTAVPPKRKYTGLPPKEAVKIPRQDGQLSVMVTLVDSRHPKFDSIYFKKNCNVEVEMNELEVNMNRRAWTAVMDLFGLLGGQSEEKKNSERELDNENDVDSWSEEYSVHCALRIRSLRVHMCYPTNRTRLGTIHLKRMEILSTVLLNDTTDSLSLAMTMESAKIDDQTPVYSEMYPDKMILCQESGTAPDRMELRVIKYLTEDEDDSRDCDVRISLIVPPTLHFYYVHTHRFFCAVVDYWTHFFELQDLIRKRRDVHIAVPAVVENTQGARVELDVCIECATTLVVPLNQFSTQSILLEATSLVMKNTFENLSEVGELFKQYSVTTEYGFDSSCDPLLDHCSITLKDLRMFEAIAVPRREAPAWDAKSSRVIGQEVFERTAVVASTENIFNKRFDLTTQLLRNLDGTISHNAPDTCILLAVHGLSWRVTTEFYKLLRGVLELNFGEFLVTLPETIPLEILQKPDTGCDVARVHKYATLSFRLSFDDVELDCQVSELLQTYSKSFMRNCKHFGLVHLRKARISFDSYIDGQSELDLICQSIQLYDTRECLPSGDQNVFKTVLQSKELRETGLMAEAHIMLKPDEVPVVTLVLLNATVFCVLDWIDDAKNFLVLRSSFEPKEQVLLVPMSLNYGVVERKSVGSNAEKPSSPQTFALRVTVRDCDFFALESTENASSFALVATTSAVVNMSDPEGQLAGNLEIQSIILNWCLMNAPDTTRSECSNEFKLTIGFELDRSTLPQGLPQLARPKHQLQVELVNMIGRLSYRDFRVIQSVLQGFVMQYNRNFGKSCIPCSMDNSQAPPAFEIGKMLLKTEHVDAWILDDFQGGSIPILRVSLSNLSVERKGDRLVSAFCASCDYFNQRVFGWEPLVERWKILRLLITKKDLMANIELITETKSTLDINLTQQLLIQSSQLSERWTAVLAEFERDDFRQTCSRGRTGHLPYLLKNITGCDISFTTAVEDVQTARSEQRKPAVKWIPVKIDKEQTFEFPTKLLLYSHTEREPTRQLIIRVSGWEETSPVGVDACGTYFRIVKSLQSDRPNARLVIRVTMEKDGRKIVTVCSSLDICNQLPHPIRVFCDDHNLTQPVLSIEPGESKPVPLQYAHHQFLAAPVCSLQLGERADITWKSVKVAGEVLNRTQRLDAKLRNVSYWLCTSVRREHYPQHETLPGHTIAIVSPISVENLLPVDIELRIQESIFAIGTGKECLITSIDITKDISMNVTTDRLTTLQPCVIVKANVGEGQQHALRLVDRKSRMLDVYCFVKLATGGSISVSVWAPYWIVNKSGIPLVIKQEATGGEAAGQMDEHERAKDRHPLMFSYSDEGCPKQCVLRVGKHVIPEKGYRCKYSSHFALVPGVQAIKISLVHDSLPTLYYNIGVEVRPGTGRYKDTQVVLLTSRYVLSNRSNVSLSVCHHDLVEKSSEHVHLASGCNLVWNENYEDCRMLRIRRSDVKHWSFPFRIDRIGSFHVTMRDADETPRFVRVETILNSAVFCVTFTDAEHYPPPIRIDNCSEVPILYQQEPDSNAVQFGHHLRTLCKAGTCVDYAWDNIYGTRRILLQVYENKFNVYDPSVPTIGPPLIYENFVYLQLSESFNDTRNKTSDDCELVLETMSKGKVMVNKMNRIDGNSSNQLWKFAKDGCIENVGMSLRSKCRMVLGVLEKTGNQLMMVERSASRDQHQKWTIAPDGRFFCHAFPSMLVTRRLTDVHLAPQDRSGALNDDGVCASQGWKTKRQRAGSGILDVECAYNGPTLVLRITDREKKMRSISAPMVQHTQIGGYDVSITMRSGIGISLVNGLDEELVYAQLSDIVVHATVTNAVQVTASVNSIQVDNQLLVANRWQVLYCRPEAPSEESSIQELPAGVSGSIRPALKLEMNCLSMKHYDAFDCFRLKLCDMTVQLDELLLWKLVQFAQATDASEMILQRTLALPPNTEVDFPDPLKTRRWYFGTLDLEMGQIGLSVVTVPKTSLPKECRQLKQQFNVKLVSFENASVSLPPFRQFHYFETSTFLVESLKKFYLAELQKQTLSIVVTLDAFGNPQGLVTDLKDSFQGLVIEGDVQRFVAGLGYGVSNSISKMASSAASGVGSFTYDEEHEAKRRHNMIRSQSATSTPLSHLYTGVKGLGVGVMGGAMAILTNTMAESKKSGIISGTVRGIGTGLVDTFTKPVQGLFDFVDGTASAMKELAGSSSSTKRSCATSRCRPPRLCRNLYHLLPSYNVQHAAAQLELLRINGFNVSERLFDLEICLEHLKADTLIRQYALISSEQCYVCRQEGENPSTVITMIPYKHLKSAISRSELQHTFPTMEVTLILEDRQPRVVHVWCSRIEVARRLVEKLLRAKQEYDHCKRTLLDKVDA